MRTGALAYYDRGAELRRRWKRRRRGGDDGDGGWSGGKGEGVGGRRNGREGETKPDPPGAGGKDSNRHLTTPDPGRVDRLPFPAGSHQLASKGGVYTPAG